MLQMHFHGILKTDDMISRFFRLCTEMCVDLCYRALSEQTQSVTRVRVQCFHTLDAFVRLTVLLLKHSGDVTNTQTKINLLNKVCYLCYRFETIENFKGVFILYKSQQLMCRQGYFTLL